MNGKYPTANWQPVTGNSQPQSAINVSIRPIPYPYQAMLAICSDLDETPDFETYFEIIKYLNSGEPTGFGDGLGLEVGNSIYFHMPCGEFSYWNTDEEGRDIVRSLIRSGYIDCLHSYGDLALKRKQVENCLEDLIKHDCYLKVWVDHAQAPTNFGPDIMQGRGDIPGDEAYHADLTLSYGVKYVWLGRVTSVIGQEIPRKLSGIWNVSHPISSAKTLFKETIKGFLARCGSKKYAMHAPNKIMRQVTLRDGQNTLEFIRSTFHWGGISYDDTAQGLKDILTKKKLDLLVQRGGVSIIYTHLGKLGKERRFSKETGAALRLLRRYYKEKKILVTTTYRLLHYIRMLNTIKYTVRTEGNWACIDVMTDNNISDFSGLSFYVSENISYCIRKQGQPIGRDVTVDKDETGRLCASISWQLLELPSF